MINVTIWIAKYGTAKSPHSRNLNNELLRIMAYSDSGFAYRSDLRTQLGYPILPMNYDDQTNWLSYSSYKYERVVCFVLE